MALLLVIWVLALLSLLAAGLTVAARSEAVLVRNREQSAQAQALAEAGVSLAILGLLETDPVAQWRADGEERHFAVGGGRVSVVVQDEGGKIDINQADEILLSGLFAEFVEARTAADLASAIVATRMRPRSEATPAASPPTGLFATVDQVREVPGIDPLLFERIAPFLTVHSGLPRINPHTAPRDVLLALPGVAPAEVDRLLAMRRSEATSPGFAGADIYLGRSQAQVVSIRAIAETEGGSVFVRETVVTLFRNPAEPYRILSWRRGE
jgi:general secretion pathway protein K